MYDNGCQGLRLQGHGGDRVPYMVVRDQVNPSVTSIPARAFDGRKGLTEVELCEGLVEIGDHSFRWCDHSITKINVPNSLRRINDCAFSNSLRTSIRLHNYIESIGYGAFSCCIFTNFRVPPLITVIPKSMLNRCKAMFSLELSEKVTEIGVAALGSCYCLHNVAFPPYAVKDDSVFIEDNYDYEPYDMSIITDLQRLFGNLNARIIWELQHRFDELPIHSIIYYHSYNPDVLQILISPTLDPTGNQQDCLGMTLLHILACSSVHNLEVYRLIVGKYPENLITKEWGALPLLYVFWGAAPAEIIQSLLESYQSLYPGHVFNWTMMVESMGRTDTPKKSIEKLLCVKEIHFPEQPIDWDHLLIKFPSPSYIPFDGAPFLERMQFLIMCGLSTRVEGLPFKVWRDYVTHMIHTANFQCRLDNSHILCSVGKKLAHF